MPEFSGWEVAAAIKAIAPNTPVALVTGWGMTLDRVKLKEAGIDLVLSKPFQYPEVMTVVAEAMELLGKI
jgi:CheY-like chemotaxis protein